MLTPEIEAIFNTGSRLVHHVTLRPDGRPHVTIVWSGVEDGEIVIPHLKEHRKVKNIRNDARVALSVATGARHPNGLDEYVVVEGVARVTEGGAGPLLQTLAKRYVGPDAIYPLPDQAPEGFVTRVRVTKVGGLHSLG